jgi:hypothetical protein
LLAAVIENQDQSDVHTTTPAKACLASRQNRQSGSRVRA